MSWMKEMRLWFIKRWWSFLLLIPLLVGASFVIWARSTPEPMPEAIAALESDGEDDGVLATDGDWLTFRPTALEPSTGFIFYPGGRVDPRAYAPAARAIAAEGHMVVVVSMPLNLAVLGPNRASAVMQAFQEVSHWAVGGHSLGGAMAARYAYGHPSAVSGLILWASYPAEGDDLSERDLLTVSIYATRDGLATPDEIERSRPLLPTNTRWVAIEGGNHAQFGWYGSQAGDNPPAISREQQQLETVAATVDVLQRLSEHISDAQ